MLKFRFGFIKVSEKIKKRKRTMVEKYIMAPAVGLYGSKRILRASKKPISKSFLRAVKEEEAVGGNANKMLKKYLKENGLNSIRVEGPGFFTTNADRFSSHYFGAKQLEEWAKMMGMSLKDMIRHPGLNEEAKSMLREAESMLKKGQTGKIKHSLDVASALHEGGHAANWKHLNNKTGMALLTARSLLPKAGLVGALAASAMSDDGVGYAPEIAAASVLPLVGEEGLASARAVKFMAKEKGLRYALKNSKSLGLALGSYAMLGIAPYLGFKYAPRGLSKIKDYIHNNLSGGNNAKTNKRTTKA